MERLNLTLDEGTSAALARRAQREGKPRAAVAREILVEGLAHREAQERRRKLAKDYADGRADASELASVLDEPQLDLLHGDAF
jgi:hypothetical protein